MFPAQFIECITWASLDRHQSSELIVLKGQLILELMLDIRLGMSGTISAKALSDISFSKKITLFSQSLLPTDKENQEIYKFCIELNKLRNRLAHEVSFTNCDSELEGWAKLVLNSLPSTKFQKYTKRTMATQAIAALAKAIYEPAATT